MKYEPLRRAAVRLLDDRQRGVVPLLHRLLAEVGGAPRRPFAKAAVEPRQWLVAAVAAECHVALLERVVHRGRLQGEAGEAGNERAVVAAAAHLQRPPVPRGREVDLELEARRRRVLRLHDAGDLAVVAVQGWPCSSRPRLMAMLSALRRPVSSRPIADAGIDMPCKLAQADGGNGVALS